MRKITLPSLLIPRLIKRKSKKAGLPPGTAVHVGDRKVDKVAITVMDYDAERVEERPLAGPADLPPRRDTPAVTWINVDGLHETSQIEQIAQQFDLHPLVVEDVVDTTQRPKIEDHTDYLFIVLRMLSGADDGEVVSEQVSLVLGADFVISFQERPGDVFDPVRARIRSGKGRVRQMDAGYLAYSLLDAAVDNYFAVLERLGDRVESLQDELLADPTPRTLSEIHRLRQEMILVRRSVWPLREVVSALERADSPLVPAPVRTYLRDVYDHTIQVIETAETLRDMLASMLDTYLSSVSNKMNEVMKVLTIIATIFIPLTFLAGVYGMNFKYMPELEWPWGYPFVVAVMAGLALVMLAYFKRKRWL